MKGTSDKPTRRKAFTAENAVRLTRAWDALSDEDKARHGADLQVFCAWISAVLALPIPVLSGGNVYKFADLLGVDIRTRGRILPAEQAGVDAEALAALEQQVREQRQLIVMLARVVQGLIPEGRIPWLDAITADGDFAAIEREHLSWAPIQIQAMLARHMAGDTGVAVATSITPERAKQLQDEGAELVDLDADCGEQTH